MNDEIMIKKSLRSTNHEDFQHLPQKLAVMVKQFENDFYIKKHSHHRHQLLYATSGIMQLYTDDDIWIVPIDRAIYIPAKTEHSLKMIGDVTMRTIYIDPKASKLDGDKLRVITITKLMRELIIALGNETLSFQANSRGGLIAELIEMELELAENKSLNIPLPKDPRLKVLCTSLLKNPSDRKTLDDWAVVCGASPRTLSRLFKKDLGLNFRRWRQLIRFHYALELLEKNKSIKSVAIECGYHSPSAFTAAFQSYLGHLPSLIMA